MYYIYMDYKPLTNWDARPSRLTYIYKVFFPSSESHNRWWYSRGKKAGNHPLAQLSGLGKIIIFLDNIWLLVWNIFYFSIIYWE